MSAQKQLTNKDLELISKSLDEGISEFERRRLGATLVSMPGAESVWARYHAVSAVIKKQFPVQIDRDFSDRVMQAINKDQPQKNQPDRAAVQSGIKRAGAYVKQVAGLAVAASVAAFSVVTYEYFNQPEMADSNTLMVSDKKPPAAQPAVPALQKPQQVEFSPAAQLHSEAESLASSIEERAYNQALNPYIYGHAGYGSQRIISPYVEVIELRDMRE